MRSYAKHIRSLVVLVVLMLGSTAAINTILDPFQILHDQLQSPAWYSTNHRFQAAGLIRKLLKPGTGYNGVIIGTSMTLNFRPSEVSTRLGWGSVVPLSVSGGSAWELHKILDKALSTGQVKYALVGIHHTYIHNSGEMRVKRFPYYLYNGFPITYLFGWDTLRASYEAYVSRNANWKTELDSYNLWTPDTLSNNSAANLKSYQLKLEQAQANRGGSPHARQQEWPSFDDLLLQQIAGAPDTQFLCFFPPYSLYFFATLPEADFERLMDFYEHVVNAVSRYDNAKVYGFDTCFDFTGNLANYSDATHYRAEMNSYILKHMAQDSHHLTPQTWPDYRRALTREAVRYQLRSDFEAVSTCIP